MGSKLGKTFEDVVTERTRVQTRREMLRTLLEDRFTTIPEAILQQIESCQDEARLIAWFHQAVRINSLPELRLE